MSTAALTAMQLKLSRNLYSYSFKALVKVDTDNMLWLYSTAVGRVNIIQERELQL